MKIKIENIGKISNSLIEIKGITVIAGYNSTGKSTISKALVGVLSAYNDLPKKLKQQRFWSIKSALFNGLDEATTSSLFPMFNQGEIEELVAEIVNSKKFELTKEKLISSFPDMDEQEKEEVLKNYESIKGAVKRYQNLSYEAYLRFIVSNYLQRYFNQQISSFDNENTGKIEIVWPSSESISVQIENSVIKKCSYIQIQEELPVYIEPQHVLDVLKKDAWRASELEKKLKDEKHGLDEKTSLAEYEYTVQIQNVIEELKKNITHGFLKKNENSITFFDEDFSHDVDVKNVASGIKSMAMILRLLENGHLKPGGILVIDEPEVNLHPQWQLSFAEFLVLLNQKLKIRVLLNTHSPFFLRAVEVYSERYEVQRGLKLYLTQLYDKKMYTTIDVTDKSEKIYKQLYMPLELL